MFDDPNEELSKLLQRRQVPAPSASDVDMNKTQKTRAVRREELKPEQPAQSTPDNKKAIPEPQNPKFGLGSLGFLLFVVWAAQTLGLTFPGPVDDYIWDLIGTLLFGLVQYLRFKLPTLFRDLYKKYPKFFKTVLIYFGKENRFDEEE